LILISATTSLAIPSSNQCRYNRKLVNRTETGVLEYGAAKIQDVQAYGQSYTNLANMGEVMAANLQGILNSQIESEFRSTVPEYDYSSTTVAGPFKFEIGGQVGSNIVDASLALKSIGIKAHFTKSKRKFGIKVSVRCSVSINTANPLFKGNYDIANNLINFSSSQINFSHNQDCSSSFGWIPILGNYIDNYITGKVGKKLDSMLKSIVQSRLSQSYLPGNFAGLQQAIPDGKLIYSGIDYGRALRDGLVDLFQHNRVIAKFSPRSEESASSVTDEMFSIHFTNKNLKFSVLENRKYEMVWAGGNRCQEP
jgi:hypothetical protein